MKKKFLCAVSVLKDEEIFVDEWLVYHKMLGIEYFFLFDDGAGLPLRSLLKVHEKYCSVIPWFEAGRVKRNGQIEAFRLALSELIQEFEWVIFLDVDEFVVLKDDKNIEKFLGRFPMASAVSLNWHLFGHNGFFDDPNRLITSSLTKRRLKPHHEEKTFSRTSSISKINSPHYCDLKSGVRVDANGKKFNSRIYPEKTKIAHINHYQCRSFSRWMKRAERGDVNYIEDRCPISEKWRIDQTLLFEKFISDVARSNNEIEDNFLAKFRFKIQDQLQEIKRNRKVLNSTGNKERDEKIKGWLKENICALSSATELTSICYDSSDLLEIIVLFHYARYTKQKNYKSIAQNKLTKIIQKLEEIDIEAKYNLFFEFGIAIEYLVESSFIRKDTNRYLKDIDLIASYRSAKLMDLPVSNKDFIKQLSYHISRLTNPFNNLYVSGEVSNKNCISQLISKIELEVWNPDELLDLLRLVLIIENKKWDVLPVSFTLRMLNLISSTSLVNDMGIDFSFNDLIKLYTLKNRHQSMEYKCLDSSIAVKSTPFSEIDYHNLEQIFGEKYEHYMIRKLMLDRRIIMQNASIKDFEPRTFDSEFRNSFSPSLGRKQIIASQSLFFLKVLNEVTSLPYGLFCYQF